MIMTLVSVLSYDVNPAYARKEMVTVKLKKGWSLVLLFSLIMGAIYCPNMSAAKSKKVKLNKTKVSLKNKQKYTLKLKGVKNRKVKWSSSNKKVATVKKGVVSAKKAGKCVVTAKYAKGKYKCTVIVVKSKKDDINTKDTEYSANPSHTPAPSVNKPDVDSGSSEGNDYNYDFSTIHDFSDVPMEAQYVSEENILFLKISNNSGTDISTSEYFELEFYDGRQWIPVDFKGNPCFADVLLVIKNGTDYTQSINMRNYFASLEKGRYRISKQISAANKGIIQTEFIVN